MISKEINLQVTPIFQKNWEAINTNIRYIENVGGSRSSKTYSIIQTLIVYCLQNPNTSVSVIRATGPALTATVQKDFIEIMNTMGIWDSNNWSMGERTYKFFNNSIIEFFSADHEQKLRGRKRDIAWVNEANELSYDIFQQIKLRTNKKIIFDYNPSMMDHYLYNINLKDKISIHSTYLDNPFLPQMLIDEIAGFKDTDESYYQIFALGKRSHGRENIYGQWDSIQNPGAWDGFIYALDFGYTAPSAMVKIYYQKKSRRVHLEEIIYESSLTSTDLVEKMNQLKIDNRTPIICDSARPEIIEELNRAGYVALKANKAVRDGITIVKTYNITVDGHSHNILTENANYRWRRVGEKLIEEPVKSSDHHMDAIRYGIVYIRQHLYSESTNNYNGVMSFKY
jgi:phage terminase large subunit